MVVPLDPPRNRRARRPARPPAPTAGRPTLELIHQRVDDVPLLIGSLIQLRIPETVDRILPPHPLHQGLSNGWLITVWLTYILSQGDHRKSPFKHGSIACGPLWRHSSARPFGPSSSTTTASG